MDPAQGLEPDVHFTTPHSTLHLPVPGPQVVNWLHSAEVSDPDLQMEKIGYSLLQPHSSSSKGAPGPCTTTIHVSSQ